MAEVVVMNISQVQIAASLTKVWEALTIPRLVKQWQYGSDLQTNWQIGSRIRFRTVWQETIFEQWGTVLEFQPKNLIRYSLFVPRPNLEDKPENYFTMTYRLTENSNSVSLEIIREDDRPGAIQEGVQGEDNPILAELKKVAEQ
jgi:uncharacterized protein YndB with AHSA1/START domain